MSMIPDEGPALPPQGHNQPPSPVESLAAEQRDALKTYEHRRGELVAAADAKKVFDRISAGDAGDIIRIARDVYARIDQDRRDRTDPYRRATEAAKGAVDEFWQPVVDSLDALRQRLKDWTDAEDARIEQQQAEQDAAMRAMREQAGAAEKVLKDQTGVTEAAAGDPPPRSGPVTTYVLPAAKRKIRGDLGATVATVERAQFRVVDIKLIPDWIMATPTVHDAIIAVVKSMAKHAGPIPGIERTTISDNQIR
jgi:hypothetical protein